jgi:hypothetical protein
MAGLLLAAAGGIGAWAWWLYGEDPEVNSVLGPQPGELTPSLTDVDDNVRNYGRDFDLPYRFSTNSLGFRGLEPTGDGPRIVVLGDSFAFGMGVSDAQCFPAVLGRVLAARVPGVRVLNGAVPGYSIVDHTEQYVSKLRAYAPDLILIGHTSSDVKEMARAVSFRRLLAHDDEDPARFDADVQRLIDDAGGEKAAALRKHWMFNDADLVKRAGTLSAMYVQASVALAKQMQAGGSRVAFILWADAYGIGGNVDALEKALAAVGVPSFRASAAMAKDTKDHRALFLPDDHFSALGNELTGQQVGAWLLASGLVQPGRPAVP